jgi:late competence protein required for DNA uptake (superfamily II DNA/RNA helicase)
MVTVALLQKCQPLQDKKSQKVLTSFTHYEKLTEQCSSEKEKKVHLTRMYVKNSFLVPDKLSTKPWKIYWGVEAQLHHS